MTYSLFWGFKVYSSYFIQTRVKSFTYSQPAPYRVIELYNLARNVLTCNTLDHGPLVPGFKPQPDYIFPPRFSFVRACSANSGLKISKSTY